jgi:hypothetical protein
MIGFAALSRASALGTQKSMHGLQGHPMEEFEEWSQPSCLNP